MSGFKSLYQPYVILERMLSESATFQQIVGAANAAEALGRIKFIACQDYDRNNQTYQAVPCPRAAIWNLNPAKKRSSSGSFSTQPRLLLSLEIEIPNDIGPTEDEQFRYCGPLYEAIEDELAVAALTPGNLYVMEINYLQVPAPADPKQNNGRRLWGADIEFVCQG